MPVYMDSVDRTHTVESGGYRSLTYWLLDFETKKLILVLQWFSPGNSDQNSAVSLPLTMNKGEEELTDTDLKNLLSAVYVAYQDTIPGSVKNLKAQLEQEITRMGEFMDSKAHFYAKGVAN